jgi:protein SCO1/2
MQPTAEQAVTSIFDAPERWTDDDGRPVTFSQWRGRPLVLTAIYTQCRSTCPRTIERLRKMYEAARAASPPPEFVLVTLDPERDAPDRLRAFKQSARLPGAWHLVVGSAEGTRAVLDILDVHVLASDAHIVHDGRIATFDAQGHMTHRYGGWGLDEDQSTF